MGMYTALHLVVELKKETPPEVINILKFMCNEIPLVGLDIPDHEFFSTQRWKRLFTSDSYYFAAMTHCRIKQDDITGTCYLTVTSNIKNYDNEIQKFLNWINPYLDCFPGEFIGYTWYEEADTPTPIYYHKL